jgi:hypothetical protein
MWSRVAPRQFVEPLLTHSRSLLFWLAGWRLGGWVCVCVPRVITKNRWSSPGSRCGIPQAPGHPRILLPLCVLPNSPASGLASSHSGVARNDSHRTVSSTASFHGFLLPRWRLLKPLSLFPSLLPSLSLPLSLPLTSTHLLVILYYTATNTTTAPCTRTRNQGSNRRADPSQTRLVKGTAHSSASARKRDVERG